MSRIHKVNRGDSIASLAEATGHFPGTIWLHPKNEALRTQRGNMNILAEGDEVFIPDLREKVVSSATGQRHCFRRRGVPAVFRLQLLRDGQPRKNLQYRLEVDGGVVEGVTDDRGVLEAFVPPSTRELRLSIGKSAKMQSLKLGHLEPADTLRGMQQRLRNLGLGCPTTGLVDEGTRTALRAFQRQASLPMTGNPDAQTVAALRDAHDKIRVERS